MCAVQIAADVTGAVSVIHHHPPILHTIIILQISQLKSPVTVSRTHYNVLTWSVFFSSSSAHSAAGTLNTCSFSILLGQLLDEKNYEICNIIIVGVAHSDW